VSRAARAHLVFVLAAFAVLMSSIDNTIVAVALPQLTSALDAPLSWASWTLTAYQLVQVVMFPLAGKLSDSMGRTRMFLFSVTTFTIASLLCSLAPNIGLLVLFRGLQAIGGGGLLPSAVGIIADQYRERRAQAVGLIGSAMPLGTIIGPNLGGFLLELGSWRALFWINVPIGVLIVVGMLLLSPRLSTGNRRAVHVDVQGLALYAGALVCLTYAMSLVAADPGQARAALVPFLVTASLVLAVVFVRHARRASEPIMDYRLLAQPPFLAANLYNFFFGGVTLGVFSFVPYYAVVHYGLSPFQSGAVLTPRALLVFSTSIVGSVYVIRFGYRWPMLVGMALNGLTLLLLAIGSSGVQVGGLSLEGFWWLATILAIAGLGNGFGNPASNNAALELAPQHAAAITGIRSTFRLTGGALSIAAMVLALSFFHDQALGFRLIFLVFTGVLVASVPLVFAIPDLARERHRRETASINPSEAIPTLRATDDVASDRL
jgi:EmrB/QacA subfamily drug resistance transporter